MQLKIIDEEFSICKVEDISNINLKSDYCFIGKNYKSKCFNIIKQIRKERYFKKIIYKDSIRNYVFNHYNNILIRSAVNHFADKHL